MSLFGLFLALGFALPWALRWISPRGWARPGAKNVLLLSLAAAAWIAVGAYLSEGEGGVRELGPFVGALFVGMIVVEGCLLVRPRKTDSDEDRMGEPDGTPGDDEEDPLSPEAERLLQRALGLEATSVEELMTRRGDVLTVQGGFTAAEVLEEMRRTGRTRLVIIEGSLDRILGVAHAKDLVPLVLEGRSAEPVRRHLRRVLRVPRRVSARRLLEEFRRNRVTIGAVADVRGRTLGIVALSDVFDFIVSEPGNGTVGPRGGEDRVAGDGRGADGGAGVGGAGS